MKRFVRTIVIVVLVCAMAVSMLLTGISGCSKKTYVIATDPSFAPFEFEDADGEYVGIDIDILAAIAQDQGFKYEVQAISFDTALNSVKDGNADGVICAMSATEARKEYYDFSDTYYDSGIVMAVSADDDKVTGYSDLSGQTVAAKTGTEDAAYARFLAKQYDFSVTTFKTSPLVYRSVDKNETVACFDDYPMIYYQILQGANLKIVTKIEQPSSYAFAVAKGKNSELLSMFNKGLADIKANGTYQAIIDKYLAGIDEDRAQRQGD